MTNRPDHERRRFLTTTAVVVGGVGAAGSAFPFAASMLPSEKTKLIGGDMEVDISGLKPGELKITKWRGMPIWILRRTPSMLQDIMSLEDRLRDPDSETSDQPNNTVNSFRSIDPEVLVLVGVCTHLGCSPNFVPEHSVSEIGSWWRGGFFCPCHYSEYDLSGRVFKGRSPAPRNLIVPPYRFLDKDRLLIGDQSEHA